MFRGAVAVPLDPASTVEALTHFLSRATALVGVPRLWYLFHKKIFDQVKQQPAPVPWLFAALLRVNGWLQAGFNLNAGKFLFKRIHAGFGGRLHLAVSAGASFDADVALLLAMRASAAGLRAGRILNLYPEGQRTFDGALGEFRHGAAILATELNLPIVPAALDGMQRVWSRGSKLIRPAQITLNFGAPFMPAEAITADVNGEARYQAVTTLLKQRIQQMLNESRKLQKR